MADKGASPDPRWTLLDDVFNKMIVKNFKGLPKWLQAFVYFIFVMFFITTAYRLVAGQYVVHGVLWEDGKYAKNCEIRIGEGFFTSNSKGIYYVVLGPVDYLSLTVTRSANLPIVRRVDGDDMKLGTFKVAMMSWSSNEFEELDLKHSKAKLTTASPAMTFDLVSSAHAQVPISRNDRLVLQSITLGAGSKSRLAEFKLDLPQRKGKSPLLVSGTKVGDLPIRPGMTVSFDGPYYFEVPTSYRGQKVQIELDDQSGAFFIGYNEDFDFTLPRAGGSIKPPRGNRGSTLALTLVPAGSELKR